MSGIVIKKGKITYNALYLVDLRGIAKRIDTYCVTGSGFLFAEYVLSRLYKKEINMFEAINIIIYVIEEVKKNDPNCGGEVKISAIDNELGLMPQSLKNKMIPSQKDLIAIVDSKIKKVWQDLIINPAKDFKEIVKKKKQIKGKTKDLKKKNKNEKKRRKTNKQI